MSKLPDDEWQVICGLLPEGWRDAARDTGAFRRARYITDPGDVLRLLLLHAVNGGSLRETAALARAGGLAEMSQVGLLKRIRSSGEWLSWLAQKMCADLRDRPQLPESWCIRAIDSTSISGPASTGTDWRIHYSINLSSLDCDWHEVTDVKGAESLSRTPMAKGDLILADRNYLNPKGLSDATSAGAHVLIRLRWMHLAMSDASGKDFRALKHAKRLRVGRVGDWPVTVRGDGSRPIAGRVISLRLPRPLAELARQRVARTARRKNKELKPETLEAAQLIMLFTTVPEAELSSSDALELYRCRWQVELAFKRLKQLLHVGRLPHQDEKAARSWILAKLVIALLIEKILRNAKFISPWGYCLRASKAA